MTASVHAFHRYADVEAALADPRLVPVPAEDGPPGTTAWLRAHVSRFSSGAEHTRRRALVEAELARLDPAALRRAAAAPGPGAADADPRLRAVRALAEGIGLTEPDAVAAAVATVARAYFGTDDPATRASADAAVAWLLPGALAVGHQGGDAARPDRPAPSEPAWEPAWEAAANRIGAGPGVRRDGHARRARREGRGVLPATVRRDRRDRYEAAPGRAPAHRDTAARSSRPHDAPGRGRGDAGGGNGDRRGRSGPAGRRGGQPGPRGLRRARRLRPGAVRSPGPHLRRRAPGVPRPRSTQRSAEPSRRQIHARTITVRRACR